MSNNDLKRRVRDCERYKSNPSSILFASACRPRTYRSPEHFAAVADKYFEMVRDANEIPISSGLTLFMGFSSREAYHDFGRVKPEYAQIIATAMHFVEQGYESGTAHGDDIGGGKKFLLKSIFKHAERSEIDLKPVTVDVAGADVEL